jgi:anti-sigma B factor antagonist
VVYAAYSRREPGSPEPVAPLPPPPDFSVDVLRHPGALVVAPRGEVDMATVDEVRRVCDVSGGMLVLDLRAVDFLDTSGLSFVLERQRHADADGSSFSLVRGPEHVQRLFDIAGLNHRLRFVADPAEALGDGRSVA